MATLTKTRAAVRPGTTWRERNPVRIGVIGVIALVVIIGGLFNAHAVVSSFSSYGLKAEFAEAGGLTPGSEVRLYGQPVGRVTGMKLDIASGTVRADFQVQRGLRLESGTRAAVKTATALGVKYLNLEPEGTGALKAGDLIPVARTTSAYDVTQALADLTTTASGIDTAQLAGALNEVSGAFKRTPTQLGRALDGVQGLSDAVARRDEQVKEVFAHAAQVSGVLNSRRSELENLIVDGDRLATELTTQRAAIAQMIRNVDALTVQLQALVRNGQKSLRPALIELQKLLKLLNGNQKNLQAILSYLPSIARGTGESVGNGPFFTAYVGNLTPSDIPFYLDK